MNFYAYVDMPIEKNGRLYHIYLPIGAPYSECKEVFDLANQEMDRLITESEAQKEKESIENTAQ
jgi:hypothetical protein